jgi:hypothetical protein
MVSICHFSRKIQQAISTLTLLCAAASSYAFDSKQFLYHDLWHGHTVVQLGNSWSIQGENQNINIQGLIGDRFTVTNGNGTNGLVGIGYYLDGQNKSWGQMAYGLNFFYLAPTAVTGTVMQEQLYTNLSFRYNVTNYPLYAAAKATINTKSPQYAVTLDGGIGPNFVHTSGFAEYPLDGITIPDHIFSGKSSTQFTATVGAGIKVNHFFGNAPLECGYRFFYLGQGANFNALTNQVLNTLNTGTMYANAVLCSITV